MFRSLFISLMLATMALAQSGLDKSLIFAGTSATSGPETYSWLIWQPTDPLFISTNTVAMYRKIGGTASPATFTRVSIVEPSADTRLIESMLPVAEKLGQNMADLETLLTDMLGDAAPAGTVTVAQKLSALIAAAHGNAENTQRLILLGRQHPAVALALGIAVADPVPAGSTRTYELRAYDRAADADLGVLGRVTLNAASVLVLPAPTALYEVPDTSTKGDLNVAMRWATPNNLRDLSPLHYGYDVYRVPMARAVTLGWNSTPPSSTGLLVAEPQTQKVNRLAVLPQKLLYAPESLNTADTSTVFLLDDNSRFNGGVKFTDGNQFMYFAVARDLLGRGGVPSVGLAVTIKDRMPPNPPQKVRVRSVAHYDGVKREQRFVIDWQAPELPAGETISAWYVYRWRTPKELATKGAHLDEIEHRPDKNLIAILPSTQTTFTDDGTSTPPAWAEVDEPPPDYADAGKTYFFTVRAVDGSVSRNFSGNSAPAWGVIRDRDGPDGVEGEVMVNVCNPSLVFTSYTQVPLQGLTNDQGHFLLSCVATPAEGWAWAEFATGINATSLTPIGGALFRQAGAQMVAALRRSINYGDTKLWCRVGTRNGRVTQWVSALQEFAPNPQEDKYILALWNATLAKITVPGLGGGWTHESVDPTTDTMIDLEGEFIPSAGSKEYKVYRRVDGGDQTLVASGEVTTSPVTWTDPNPVGNNCTVCYYLQLFDEHGNAGPLVQQGECISSGDASYLPTPILEPLSATGVIPPRLKVNWFSSIAGVQRFEVWVGRKTGTLPTSTNSGLSADIAKLHPNTLTEVEGTEGIDFAVFETGLARHLNADGSPEFGFTLPLSLTDTYTVMVRAVGPGEYGVRMVGEFSNVETFTYSVPKLGIGLQVPWPDRPLPPKAGFHTGVTAMHLSTFVVPDGRVPFIQLSPWIGNGVRIGEFVDYPQGVSITGPDNNNTAGAKLYFIQSTKDVENYLYTNDEVAAAEPSEPIRGLILPVVMYRVQVPNTNYPSVPGDIVQVTPLMEKIAQFDDTGANVVTDPFISILPSSVTMLPRTLIGSDQDILLLDRQPVIAGARYKYLVVRLGPNKEIERVIVTNEVNVPKP